MLALFFIYLLKTTICLLVFSLFFRLLLLTDTFVRFSRIVLLSSLLLCLVLPLVNIEVETPTVYQQPMQNLEKIITEATEQTVMPELPQVVEDNSELQLIQEPQYKIWQHYMFWVLLIYGIGVLAMSGRLLYSFYKLWKVVKKGRFTYFEGQRVLLIDREISAFSFFRLIVLSRKDFEENPREIITHEQMHSHYLHSVDALFVELLLVVQWFNVGLWSLRNDLRALHEYEADRAVLKTGIDAAKYQLLLVRKAVGERCFTSVANSFNHSLIKNRITMMLKKETQWWKRLKVVLVVPMAVGMLYAFAQPAVVETMDNVQQDVVEVTEKPMNNWAMRVWKYIVEFDRSEGKYIVLKLRYDNKESHRVLMNKANQVMFNGRRFAANFDKNMMAKKVGADFYRKWKELPQEEEYFVPQLFNLQKDSKTDIATVVRVTDALVQGYDEAVTKISQETGKDYEDITRLNPLLIVFQKPYILPPPPPKEYREGKRDKKGNSFNDVTDIVEQKQEKQCHLTTLSSKTGHMYMAVNFPIEVLREFLKPERLSLSKVTSLDIYLGKSDTVKMETITEVKNLLRANKRLKMTYSAIAPRKTAFKVPSENADEANMPKGFPVTKSAIKNTVKYGMRIHPILKVKKAHKGVDYAAKEGTPIMATADGVVVTVGYDKKYGNRIIIKHNDKFQTLFAHLQNINVKKGQTVKKGQVIGTVGNTGISATPHLHYEIHKEGNAVNPENYN